MDCLELNIHQRILNDIAANVGQIPESVQYANSVIASKVQTRDILKEGMKEDQELNEETNEEKEVDNNREENLLRKVFMPASRAHCNIAFGELVVNFPDSHIAKTVDTLMPVLIDVLRDVPYIDFDRSLSWEDWALPDQLVCSTVSALLRISSIHREYRDAATNAIVSFIFDVVEKIKSGDAVDALTQLTPALHGLYRAISSTPFSWSLAQWKKLTKPLNAICAPDVMDRLNRLPVEIVQSEDEDQETLQFIQTFMARYVSCGRPLSGYFIVCCVFEISWTILAQVLAPPSTTGAGSNSEAAAANKAWNSLMRQAAQNLETPDEKIIEALKKTITYSMQCFTDLLVQIEEMDEEPSVDTYAWETMSESLKLASICSIVLREIDDKVYARLFLLLSDKSPISDNLVQEAALKACTILVQSFPDIAGPMAAHLRRFVTSPIPIFEFEFATESRAPPPLAAAAKCLALCIKLAPGDDLIMSNMYSLLNYIAAANKDIYETSSLLLNNPLLNATDRSSEQSAEAGLKGLSEDEKRLVGITTISVVTRLALEFKNQEVTKLTISMLLQRLRTAEPTVEAAIAYSLVDLAVSAPGSSFIDIIRVFSTINRSANPDDPRFSNNMVLAAQTRLAQELHRRPELYEIYLVELLTLFADKGVAIQNVKITNRHVKTDDMIEQLAGLLLPIDALLAHGDFNPQNNGPSSLVSLFRNMWFLCVLFNFTVDETEVTAMEWQRPALARIAAKTPAIVMEESHDFVASDVEYSSVIRQDYADTVIQKHRTALTKLISLRSSDIRYLSCGQIIFLLTMHDMESMRSAAGLPSSLVSYFVNDSLNRHPGLTTCMESIAEKVVRGCIADLNTQASQQALPESLSSELQKLLVGSTHRVVKARDVASKYLNRLISSFPSLMCDPPLVFAILEVLTLLRRACENEFIDEFNPIYEFESDRTGIVLQLTDSYEVRNEILAQLQRNSNTWLELALGRAPVELQSTLQKYLAISQTVAGPSDATELGASIAEKFGKAVGPIQRQLAALANLSQWKTDKAKVLASQIASKGYFAGEVAGLRLASRAASDKIEKLPPQTAPSTEIVALKEKLSQSMKEIRSKSSSLTVQELKRLLFRCAATLISLPQCDHELLHYLVSLPFEVSTPSAISAAIEVWTWVIAEKPTIEVAIMGEILSAWSDTIRLEKGAFSITQNYDDPFYHPIIYSPTDKKEIDRGTVNARRLLSPHALVLQMLVSRLQAARYRRPGVMFLIQHLVLRSARAHKSMSTHALAREACFSFLLFGFETLKSSHLDSVCESAFRESLYETAYSWFAVRPQWSYGANRVQVDADVRVLSEFLSYLQTDTTRSTLAISSLAPAQFASRTSYYATRLKEINHPLRLLVENEIFRLTVWANPTNDPKRGSDHISTTVEHAWSHVIRTVWQVNPAIAIHLSERFKVPVIRNEVSKLVRSSAVDVLDIPEALGFLLGDKLDPTVHRDLKLLLLWAPVPPVIANTFFEPRYKNDPLILQYAHRVLEQHPVDLTFFYVPQVVQALRYDELGYVSRFIFETAKISQLFCHQIIWNMKANTHKDDAGEEEDPLKPTLDGMVEKIVRSLSGEARAFYDREFGFFNEVTSISGKLKPFIKKTKPEKKAKIDEEMAKIVVDVGVYLPSNPDGVVVDIDKKSGRPLQSHAKAPFMATFKVRKEKVHIDEDPESLLDGDGAGIEKREEYDVWQQAIFKVGDDCRQDVLALQIIAMFKNIFESVGLTLYLYPYRVTATAPGCGVIDVVPNATSRDEMGRAKVNDLSGFFISKYGGQNTVAFQQARLNFIQSMAAYSVACYILQIKDRHNGNIMIDGEGHIVHIDFGFLFDIDESYLRYGVKFEPSSFKLNREMVELMGGRYSQGYHLFQHLTVKAFLAIRPHAEQLVAMVQLMLDSSLPSFKGEGTIKRLRDRFALGLNERQAADYMMGVIKNAHENMRSTAYDEFQRIQNGIPYK
ncbi:phosphatidylinositol 4-kinase [Moniliophthora roreri MCA 2997]|uniref:1-phosphatidylinositol 4-kinase n=1 Tax=Moniliophthora roreri (strain MCA 2997) TaxID=1381753 RepID=V2YR96_MONRO|nr:phosphatidylinositol 4-kinase [Moniliophthora roreri MCA 2997]